MKKKTIWKNAPNDLPKLGDNIIVSYVADKETGRRNKEIVEWTFVKNDNAIKNKTAFKWFEIPAID